jgi:hypothetical protein
MVAAPNARMTKQRSELATDDDDDFMLFVLRVAVRSILRVWWPFSANAQTYIQIMFAAL